jgi:hypothetical protein
MESALDQGYLLARTPLADARIARCQVLAGKGEHVRATEDVESIARQGGLQSISLYNVACFFSRSMTGVDRDTKLSAANRDRCKARYANRAMEFLRQAVAKGAVGAAVLKRDSDLEPLRPRADFQKLLADLEAKGKR